MTNNVRFHPLAEKDISAIYDFIARDSPALAINFVRRIRTACDGLAEFPFKGRDASDISPGIRIFAVERRVMIAYRPGIEGIVILRLLYAGQNLDADTIP